MGSERSGSVWGNKEAYLKVKPLKLEIYLGKEQMAEELTKE